MELDPLRMRFLLRCSWQVDINHQIYIDCKYILSGCCMDTAQLLSDIYLPGPCTRVPLPPIRTAGVLTEHLLVIQLLRRDQSATYQQLYDAKMRVLEALQAREQFHRDMDSHAVEWVEEQLETFWREAQGFRETLHMLEALLTDLDWHLRQWMGFYYSTLGDAWPPWMFKEFADRHFEIRAFSELAPYPADCSATCGQPLTLLGGAEALVVPTLGNVFQQ